VPMVVSPVIGRQMQWDAGADYFAASDSDQLAEYCIRLYSDQQLWERFRANSLARVEAELSPAAFTGAVRSVLSEVSAANRRLSCTR